MARNSNILLRVTGNADDARSALRDVRSDLRRMSREEARVRISVTTERVQRQIAGVRRELEELSRKEATPRVELQTQRAHERLALLELRLDRLRLKRVNVDVDVRRGALERAASGVGAVERSIQGVSRGFAGIFSQVPILGGLLTGVLGGAFSIATALGNAIAGTVTRGITALVGSIGSIGSLAGPIGGVVGSVVSLTVSLAGAAAIGGAVVIALNAVLGAIVALGAALVALVASLGAAIAGMGVLAVAFGGILLPVIGVAIGLFTRFAAIIKARQAQEQALAQATQEQKSAEQARTTALEQSKAAHQRLAEAVVEGRRAMAQAAEDQSDAERSLQSSKLGVREARLNLAEARRDLREFLREAGAVGPTLNSLTKKFSNIDFDPSEAGRSLGEATGGKKGTDPLELQRRILAVQRAQLGVKDSIDQVGDAQRKLNDAERVHLDYQRRGLRAYAPYRRALEQTRRAEIRLARTQDQVSAASRKYQRALNQLSGTERGTLQRVNALTKGFAALAKAFTDPVFRAANEVFDSLRGKAGGLKTALTLVGEAFGDVVRAFGTFLRERATQNAFAVMARGAASLVRELGARAFIDFLRIMRNLAVAALPSLLRLSREIAGVFRGWASSTANVSAFRHRTIIPLVHHFRVWLKLIRDVGALLVTFLRAASGSGGSLAAHLAAVARHYTRLINQNPERVQAFFRRMVVRARQIVKAVKDAVVWLTEHLPGAAATAKDALSDVAKVASDIYHSIKLAVDLLKFDFKDALKDIEAIRGPGISAGPLGGGGRKKGESNVEAFFKRLLGRQAGGIIPGIGRGDHVPLLAEPGEFMLRRGVAQSLGMPALSALNAGDLRGFLDRVGSGGRSISVTAPITVPGGGYPDARTFAALLEMELRRAG